MNDSLPHYLLFSETGHTEEPGRWRFVLRVAGSVDQFEACDEEPDVAGERLELLTVVRALESLDRPSHVTLMTPDPYIRQGIRFGLPEWRNNGWRWEFYGRMVPVKHGDLWQRVDHAMRFHRVELSKWRIDRAHRAFGPPNSRPTEPKTAWQAALERLRRHGLTLAGRLSWLWLALVAWWRRDQSGPQMAPRMG
jgi:ribonuclease HI